MTQPITAKTLQHQALRHGFFTRSGGVSTEEFTSLNVGYASGDERSHVRENRRLIADYLDSPYDDIRTCYQIHSDMVHMVDVMNDAQLEGDALVTTTPGLIIAVLTADCVPILLADMHARVIGAVHAGWKGAHKGIIEKTIGCMEQMGANPAHITAAIGPAIAQSSYEVGGEVRQQFIDKSDEFSHFFAPSANSGHYQFDLPGLVESILTGLGVAKVEKLDYDTYSNENQFYSFRRTTHQKKSRYGRQCSAIMLV